MRKVRYSGRDIIGFYREDADVEGDFILITEEQYKNAIQQHADWYIGTTGGKKALKRKPFAPKPSVEKTKEQKKQEIKLKRIAEYPPIGDQLDAIMKWAFSETEIGLPAELKSLAAKCMSVKAKYPMPE